MNENLYKCLDFTQILNEILSYTVTEDAKASIRNISMQTDRDILERKISLLNEAVQLSAKFGRVSVYGYESVKNDVLHAKKQGILREGALLKIAGDLRIAKSVKGYFLSKEVEPSLYPQMYEIAMELEPLSAFEKKISESILSENEISDTASSELYSIRRQIRNVNSSIKDKLNAIITSSSMQKYLQEAIVTIRNSRYVVPVKSENKGKVPGIVHDSSSTGLTVYIEPMPVVNLNNKLRELEIAQQKEIENILRNFTDDVRSYSVYLLNNEAVLSIIDEEFAKAEYAIVHRHTKPLFTDKRTMHLYGARHPLIPEKKVVPSDIIVGSTYSQIVITGPNTGGKTVTLKTVGLCSLLAQCGLFIPCEEGSEIMIFSSIFADIGDEQSIQQSLSTFSSHMTNIVKILDKMDENSLVLLDELGAGTDPAQGAALAWAILRRVKQKGAISLATTHYNEIKQYAMTETGVVNASVEFDVVNLKPTYKLRINMPGKSHAFLISEKLGLAPDILEEARSLVANKNVEFENIVTKLEQKLQSAENADEEANRLLRENQGIHEELMRQKASFEEQKDQLLTDAVLEAKSILNQAKKDAREIIEQAHSRTSLNSEDADKAKDGVSEKVREKLDILNEKMPKSVLDKADENVKKEKQELKKGDAVNIPSLNCEGIILNLKDNMAFVQVGVIKTKIDVSKLEKKIPTKEKGHAHYRNQKAKYASSKLDIRGIYGAEVAMEVEKFLDDAFLAGIKTLTIVHGKGEGVLSREVRKYLTGHPYVDKFRPGGLKEGGEGVTIVFLK